MQGQGTDLKTVTKENASTSNLPLTWTFSEPYSSFPFNNISNEYFVSIYDEDLGGVNQIMGTAGFRASEFVDSYRGIILLDNLSGTKVELPVKWGN